MLKLALVVCAAALACAQATEDDAPRTLADIAAAVNAAGASWVADADSVSARIATERLAGMSRRMRTAADVFNATELKDFVDATAENARDARALPTFFDARTKWTYCKTIGQIRDQKHCGDCWAAGSVSTMTDRDCIKNRQNLPLAMADVAFCSSCGGCGGAPISCGFRYWKSTGIVSEACAPYDTYIPNSWPDSEKSPACTRKCSTTSMPWKQASKATSISYVSGETAIMNQIFKFGPGSARYDVYEDFRSYTTGIYHHVTGKRIGGHVVKILGWGEEEKADGTVEKYWLIANSWGADWADNGYFKMRRGATEDNPSGECGIEEVLYFGEPAVRSQ